jgi:hypothetical protein
MSDAFAERVLGRNDPDYEDARHAAVWNARTPNRHP